MKRILIVSCLFDPEPVVSARLAKDLAEKFVTLGHRPTVLCPKPSRPLNKNYKESELPLDYNFEVVRVDSFRSPEYKILNRFYESYSLGKATAQWLKENPGFDAVYVNTWPIFGQYFIVSMANQLDIPVLLHIQDLYPESFDERLPSMLRPFLKPFYRFEKKIAQKVDKVIAISSNMMDYYRESRQLKNEQLALVNNWQDEKVYEVQQVKAGYEVIAESGQFVFMFLGNIGPVAGVELLIKAFHQSKLEDALLVIAGDGTKRKNCEVLAKQLGNEQIIFKSVPFKDTGYVLSLADVCLLPIKKGHGISSIPSKMIGYLFAHKPVLMSADLDCDSARVIKDGECGWLVDPENEAVLACLMQSIMQETPSAQKQKGQNGYEYAKQFFSKEGGSSLLAATILNTINTTVEYKTSQ